MDEVTFKADKGVFLDGQILPAIEGVSIRSSHKIDPNVFFETVTDANGRYRLFELPIFSVRICIIRICHFSFVRIAWEW